MARQEVNLQQVLLKLQSSRGSAEAELLAANVIEAVRGAKAGFTPATAPIQLLGQGFGTAPSVVGPSLADFTLGAPMRTGGAATPGQIGTLLQICRLKQSAAGSVYTYTPTALESEWKDSTLWGYSGNRDTGGSILRKMHNCMANAKIIADFRKDEPICKIEVTGKGVYDAPPAAATQVSITPSAIAVPPMRGVTLNFLGDTDYDPLLLEFDLQNAVSVHFDGTAATGLGISVFTDSVIKWHAIVYKDIAALPETAFHAGTMGTISLAFGVAPYKITLATGASKAQITEVSDGDQEGSETYDLGGIVIDDSFTVEMDCTAA